MNDPLNRPLNPSFHPCPAAHLHGDILFTRTSRSWDSSRRVAARFALRSRVLSKLLVEQTNSPESAKISVYLLFADAAVTSWKYSSQQDTSSICRKHFPRDVPLYICRSIREYSRDAQCNVNRAHMFCLAERTCT